jgi:putative transposase
MSEEHDKRQAYPSDLTEAQGASIEPLLPAPRYNRGGRPRELDLREVLNTLLSLTRSGCQWERWPQDLLSKSGCMTLLRSGAMTAPGPRC